MMKETQLSTSKRVKMRTPIANAPIEAMILTSVHRTPPLRFPSTASPSGGRFPSQRRLPEFFAPLRVTRVPEQQTEGVRDEITVVESRPKLLASDESVELLRIRHSCAHVLAMAVKRLHPSAQCTIGPWTEFGFYYDFDFAGYVLTDKDLKKISKEMRRIITEDLPFIREEVTKEHINGEIEAIGEPYKKEILSDILSKDSEAVITVYHIGEKDHPSHWWDLCAGPHIVRTGVLKPDAFKLETIAGAYWRGDEANPQLTRIYGTAWRSRSELEAYEALKKEAASRDHRKLGTDLKLFSIREEAGPGLVFWLPMGARVRHEIENYWKNVHVLHGYELVFSPHVAKLDLWKTSGHVDYYHENMFDQMDIENVSYQLRPMNCPFHILMFKEGYHSYKTLPVRLAELGTVYRYERSGTMHGLSRVRGFTQDDAHIFCLPEQITEEIVGILDLIEEIMSRFGFLNYELNLSTRPQKSVGSDEIWSIAEDALKTALNQKSYTYKIDDGGGAFYGPKIDIKIEDAIGRKWQCSTIQLDFNLPDRFDVSYIDEHGEKQRPILIHRAILGSIERFFGILVENCKGAFDFWLAPVQCKILPVREEFLPFCQIVARKLESKGLRVEITSGERMGKLIRNAETSKTPVMLVVGQKEVETDSVSVRTYTDGDAGSFPIDKVVETLHKAVNNPQDFRPISKAFVQSDSVNGNDIGV